MDISTQKQPTNHIKDRILRFKPVAFIRKNLPIFIFIFIFFLTMLLGVWNIKSYTLIDNSGLDIPSNVSEQVEKYIGEKLMGKNYFFFSTTTYEKDMVRSLSYIENVDIEKVAPNKLEIFVDLYKPSSVALLQGQECYLLSEKGNVLEQICKEDTQNCCTQYAQDKNIYAFSSSEANISESEDGKQKLLIMDSIYKVVKVINIYQYEIANMTLNQSVLEVVLKSGQLFKFSMSEDLDTQLQRFIPVANRVKSDNLEFKSIDLRFERPVLKYGE